MIFASSTDRMVRLVIIYNTVLLSILFQQLHAQDKKFGDLDAGVEAMEAGEYQKADLYFRKILKEVKVLPDEISYYFGKNSYFLGKNKQSINWLNKYIELEGTKGRFFDDAVNYLKKAEEKYRIEREREIQFILNELASEPELNCQEHDKIICPVCKGEGVIVKVGNFGNQYITCPYSDPRGLLTCAEYNLLINGELKPKL